MSTWNLGANDVSEETRTFRDKLASKDGHIAAQEDRLRKQASDMLEMKEKLDEVLHKLNAETRRALQLEDDLKQRTEELRNEKISSGNLQATLANATQTNKSGNLELRQMEANLEQLSHTSDEHRARSLKLEKEKSTLEVRIRELETNLRNVVTQPTPSVRLAPSRPRSSSLSNFRITTLEEDLNDLRSQLAIKEAEAQKFSQQLSRVRDQCNKLENERVASERGWRNQLDAVKMELEEKEEELRYLQSHGNEGGREEELLQRIEEDDAKIAALEALCQGADESKRWKEKAKRLEVQLDSEQRRLIASDEKLMDAMREREEDLEATRQEMVRLSSHLKEKDKLIQDLNDRISKISETSDQHNLLDDNSCLIDMTFMAPGSASRADKPIESNDMDTDPDPDTVDQVEKLLLAVNRLRAERDDLRRDLQFLECESNFTIEALEAKVALFSSMSTESNQTVNTLGKIKGEMDDLQTQLEEATGQHIIDLRCRDSAIRRLGLYTQGLCVALGHLTNVQNLQPMEFANGQIQEMKAAMKLVEDKYKVSLRFLEEITRDRDDLLTQLEERQVSVDIDELQAEIENLHAHIDDIESERDSLALQVTNLTTDIQNAQDELNTAESRYANLQFHQLSTMTSNEATRTLRQHIEELEARVTRRTEQIGIHQHDIRRLETNLRLQEERLNEMTTELEMMAAQKDAMVEDCADAREARDEALARAEALEEELENSAENEALVVELVGVVVNTASRARDAIIKSKKETEVAKLGALDQQTRHEAIRVHLDDKESALKTLTQLSGQYRDELERARNEVASKQCDLKVALNREDDLQSEIIGLKAQISAFQVQNYESIIHDPKAELEMRAEVVNTVGAEQEDARRVIDELKLQHAGALAILQEKLAKSTVSLQELQACLDSARVEHSEAMQITRASLVEVEKQLEESNSKLAEVKENQQDFENIKQGHLDRIATLEEELDRALQQHQDVLDKLGALEASKRELLDEFNHFRTEQENIMLRMREETDENQRELENEVQTFQGRFEEEARLLEMSKLETARLADRLEEVAEGHLREQEDRETELIAAQDEVARLEELAQGLHQEIDECRSKIEDHEGHIQTLEHERMSLQEDLTTFEAEVQKVKSLNRYLESQVKENENAFSSLKGDLERVQADLARSEKACKAAEVNLSLQNAQHKRETAELQKELTKYHSSPDLQGALSELEERNTEMEELLKTKCAEIEANDDRVLEMLKEKKKLTAKVESLNRKVQNLQAKLNAAKAVVPVQSQTAIPQVESSPDVADPINPETTKFSSHPSKPSSKSPSPAPLPISRRSPSNANSVASSSSLTHPKTPEERRTPPSAPVFKARTPERVPPPPQKPLPTEVVIGKKRAAPDDFDAGENIPTQAFLPDGKDAEGRTPRVRRVLSNLQSGFTPNRNQNRPTVPLPSPRRHEAPQTMNSHISDMTNSPFTFPPVPNSSAKPSSKRSWLGKIRGSSQLTERPSASKSSFGSGD